MKLTVPKKGENAVAKKQAISPLADVGMGTENVTSADLIIPRLTLIHEMSRVTKKQRPEFIKGAKPGMFCLASIQKLFDGEGEGILVVPVYFARRWVEWIPRDQGGGIVGSHDSKDCTNGLEKVGPATWVTEDGHEIVETPEHYFLILGENGEFERVIFGMTGTKATYSRRWLTLISNQKLKHPDTGQVFVAPSFMNVYRMKASPQSNDKGDFHVPTVTLESALINIDGEEEFENGLDLYQAAKGFHDMIAQGRVAASEDVEHESAVDEEEPEKPRRKKPF